MKFCFPVMLTLLAAFSVSAQDYRVVYSPSLKLEVWIDDLKDNSPASWCAAELPVRIVATGAEQSTVLNDFLPRVGSLLEKQCPALAQLKWQMNDGDGKKLAQGSAAKAENWGMRVEASPGEAGAPPLIQPTEAVPAVAADTTPWLQFSLIEGCHFRGYWGENSLASALFVPAKQGAQCGSDGWLSGQSQVTQIEQGTAKNLNVLFLQGFQVLGLNNSAADDTLTITTVNNQRMVLHNSESPDSWMILPYISQLSGWQADGTVAVQLASAEAKDEERLQALLDDVRKVWSPYIAGETTITLVLVEALQPQLKDPTDGAWRTIK
ncbi:hypothetical protein [Winslowiella iniecta]|uniref:Type VI secretion system-associated protein n=1 Tax=Winslowiella iniecta TaxID=1560201 RepID=A0A0L7T353_9GAMM|nr:hypothetical protein [Winslowiella iniecta]KOC88088.1 hypothetical protein NG42_17865 [Winslowiella iniecta]KOC89671.1 hypothetical protein NG43_18580 [Winslowiella iniecta]